MQSWETLRKTSQPPQWEDFGVPLEAQKAFAQAMAHFIFNDAHGFWLEPESRDGHCDPEQFVVTLGQRMSALTDMYNGKSLRRTQSPIEDMLGAALLWLRQDWAGFPEVDHLGGPVDHRQHVEPPKGVEFYLTPQAQIGAYKADFLLWFRCGNHFGGVAIECDGHAFHEKTKEQASADKRRDREILAAGYPVIRFSGSDIFRDSLDCARQVGEILNGALYRVSKDGGWLA